MSGRRLGLGRVVGGGGFDGTFQVRVSLGVGEGYGGSDPILLPDGEAPASQAFTVAFLLVAPDLT
jgi:hypothetical protein